MKIAFLSFSAFVLIGCGEKTTRQAANATTLSARTTNESVIVSGHSPGRNNNLDGARQTSPTAVPKSETRTKWKQDGNPIDTSAFDAGILRAQKDLKMKSKDQTAKQYLAEAFVKRGVALTDARQYASALGDYRRALKYDAENAEAKKWIEEILSIYAMLNRDYPKEGEEPPPLPFKKEV